MSWWSGMDEATVLLLFLLLPGLLLGAVLGLRRVLLVTAAPGLSVAVLGLAPVLLAPLGIAWNPAGAVGATLAAAVVLAAVRWLLRRWWHPSSGSGPAVWPVLMGTVLAVPVALVPLRAGMGRPDDVAQSWDAVFHLNALRYIVDTGDGSSLHLGVLNAPLKDAAFYPAAWHDIGALAVNDDIVVTANVLALLVSCVVWPLTVAGLSVVLAPRNRVAPVAGALAATMLVAFPARMISYGPLWPNTLGYALLPAALALTVVLAVRLRCRRPGAPLPLAEAVALVATLGAAGLAHPSAVLAYGVIGGPVWVPLWWHAVRAARRTGGRGAWSVAVGAPVLVAVGLIAFVNSRLFAVTASKERAPYGSVGNAIIGAFTDAQIPEAGFGNTDRSWLIAAFVVLGLVATIARRRHRWLALGMVTTTGLFVLAIDSTLPGAVLVGPWYSDPARLGGMVAIVVTPLVAVGVAWLGDVLAAAWRRRRPAPETVRPEGPRAPGVLGEAVSVLLVVVLVLGTGGMRNESRAEQLRKTYTSAAQTGFNGLVTPGEMAMMERADDKLPPDAVVLGNPFTGAALLYAVSDVDVVYPHLRGTWSEDARFVARNFANLTTDPRVCAALRDLGVQYVYDDSVVYWPEHKDFSNYRGLVDIGRLGEVLEPVDSGGGAAIYRIDYCGF